MAIDAALIKTLRERTGAGVMECKQALQKTAGDLDKAAELLRETGLAKASKKADRQTPEGLISAYIHPGNRIGVLIEVNCETDFVARNQEFQELVRDLALQIAGAHPPPRYVSREDVPAEVVKQLRARYEQEAKALGKPQAVIEQIVQGRLEKFFSESCLLEQPFIKDPETRIQALVAQKVAKTGENIRIRRFARYQLGEEV